MAPRWAHPAAFFTAGLCLLNVFLACYIDHEPYYTAHIMLVILAGGCAFLSVQWLTLLVLSAQGAGCFFWGNR